MEKDLFTPREGTQKNVFDAAKSIVENVVYYLFKSPYVVWTMSARELAKLRNNNLLDIIEIENEGSNIPYALYLFRFFVYFLLHAIIYVLVVIAPFAALYAAYDANYQKTEAFIFTFISCYYGVLPLRLMVSAIHGVALKYALPILKYIFFPVLIIYHFFDYLNNKCKFKSLKYAKNIEELEK